MSWKVSTGICSCHLFTHLVGGIHYTTMGNYVDLCYVILGSSSWFQSCKWHSFIWWKKWYISFWSLQVCPCALWRHRRRLRLLQHSHWMPHMRFNDLSLSHFNRSTPTVRRIDSQDKRCGRPCVHEKTLTERGWTQVCRNIQTSQLRQIDDGKYNRVLCLYILRYIQHIRYDILSHIGMHARVYLTTSLVLICSSVKILKRIYRGFGVGVIMDRPSGAPGLFLVEGHWGTIGADNAKVRYK